MARADEYRLIQNAIVDKVLAGPFYAVTFDDSHKAAIGTTPITPQTVIANEVAATFGEAPRNRRTRQDDYTSWTWQLVVQFNENVTLHEFHSRWNEGIILIPTGSVSGVRQTTAHLLSVQVDHAPNKQPRGGTKAIYTIDVRLRPA